MSDEVTTPNDLPSKWLSELADERSPADVAYNHAIKVCAAELERALASPQCVPVEALSGDFIRRTNEDYAAWCKTQYTPDCLDERGFPSLFGLWAWQEQERRKMGIPAPASVADAVLEVSRRLIREAIPATASGQTCFVPKYVITQLADAIGFFATPDTQPKFPSKPPSEVQAVIDALPRGLIEDENENHHGQ